MGRAGCVVRIPVILTGVVHDLVLDLVFAGQNGQRWDGWLWRKLA
jgi:hypothetical protein